VNKEDGENHLQRKNNNKDKDNQLNIPKNMAFLHKVVCLMFNNNNRIVMIKLIVMIIVNLIDKMIVEGRRNLNFLPIMYF
jgi:hypothetical protein